MLVDTVVGTVNGPTSAVLLGPVLAVIGVGVVVDVLVVVVALLLALVGLELAVLVLTLVGGEGVLPEAAGLSVEVQVRSLIALLIVELLGLAGLVLVVGSLEALDHMTLLVALLDFLFDTVLA